MSARTRRGLTLLWTALFLFSLVLQYVSFAAPASVLAVHDEGLFELDGNVEGSADPGDDWNPIYGGGGSAFETLFVTDQINGGTAANPDKYFTGGDTKDTSDLPSWLWTTVSQPQDKNDIAHAYAAAYDHEGELIVYFGLDRYASNGAAQVGFWFIQDDFGLTGGPASGGFTGQHVVGDVLVQIDFANGGANPQLRVYEWVGSGGDTAGTLDQIAAGGSCATTPAGDLRCAIAATAPTNPDWPFDDKGAGGANNDIPAGGMVEGGINLTALGLDGGCFASFVAETRSSPSPTSTLSDFAFGSFSLCAEPDIDTQVRGPQGQSLGSVGTINVGESVSDFAAVGGDKGPATGTVDFYVCGPDAAGVPDCSTGGTKVGATKTLSSGQAVSDLWTADSPSDVGFYCFRVEYTPAQGSKYLAASHTNTTTECFEVIPAQVTILKTTSTGTVSAGDPISFTLSWGNSKAGTATGVVVSDTLPTTGGLSWTISGFTGTGSTCALAANVLTCNVGSIPGNTAVSGTVTVTSQTTFAACGVIPNTGTINSGNDGSATSTAQVTVNCPDVKVTKTPDAGTVQAGDDAVFTIVVENLGPGTAYGVSLTDSLPAGYSWTVGGANAAACSIDNAPNPDVVSCDFGTMAPGATKTITLTAPTSGANCAVIPNTASVDATNEPNTTQYTANNTDSAAIDVLCGDVSITKVADAATVNAGDQVGFTITVTNSGDGEARGVTITDTLPGGIAWTESPDKTECSIAAGILTCNVGTLASGASFSVHIVGMTDAADCGVLSNTAVVTTTNDGGDQATATITVNCPDVNVTKVADADPVNAGDEIGFTITVSNAGPGVAYGVTIADTLPGGIAWTESPDKAECSITGDVLTCNVGTIAVGASFSVHVSGVTDAADCGLVSNTATVDATNEPNTPAYTDDDSATDTVTVNCPDVIAIKVADDDSVSAGDQIGFTIGISNLGPGTAYTAFAADPLPGSGWTIENQSGGWSLDGSLLTWTGELAAGASASAHVVRDTTADDCGTVPNTVQVTASNEPNAPEYTANNSASDSTDVLCPDITVDKTADVSPISAGETASFTIEVWNAGPGIAYDVTLTDTLPGGVTWVVDGTDPDGIDCDIVGTSLTCDLGDMAPEGEGDENHVFIYLSGETSFAQCANGDFELENSVEVSASNEPADAPLPNSDDAVVEVDCPAIGISKTADHADPVSAGDPVGFTVDIGNTGAGTAFGVYVEDPLPADLLWSLDTDDDRWSLSGAAGAQVLAFAGDLASGEMSSAHVSATSNPEVCGAIPNTATIGIGDEELGSDDATELVDCPDVTVTKVADDETVSAGDQIGFTVEISNIGDGTAYGAYANDSLPGSGWSIESHDGGWTLNGSTLSFAGDLAAGESSSVHVVRDTTAEDCGTVPNTVTVGAANEADEDADDNTASDSTDVLCADIEITKTADEAVVIAGDPIGFTVTVTNAGEGTAYGVKVSDPLPAGVTWSIDSGDDGWAIDEDVLSFGGEDGATLAASASVTVHITARTSFEACATYDNTATVTTTNDGSDEASDSVEVICPDIDVDKSVDDADGIVGKGQTVTYTIDVVVLDGPVPSGTVVDTLPVGQTYVDGSQTSDPSATSFEVSDDGRTLTWTYDFELGGDPAATITYQVTIDDDAATGDQTNTAEFCVALGGGLEAARVSTADDTCVSDTETVTVPELTLVKSNDAPIETIDLGDGTTVDLPTANEGDTVTYTLEYTLTNGPVTDGVLTDVLPEGATYVDGTASSNAEFSFVSYDEATRTLRWEAATVTASGSLTYDVVIADGAAELAQPLVNVATIDSAETKPSTDDSEVFVNEPPQEVTPPPTDTFEPIPSQDSNAGFALMLTLIGLAAFALVIGFITPVPEHVRRRDRRS
jgi:uncharacterized repeat protein (TIGR01451 family)/fimbrial isopeptide formation D2 family protein